MDRTALRVNIDVLLLILFLADDSSTKLALMSTCQVLYREGGKLFLKDAYIDINSEPKLASFLQFMNADGCSRMRHLNSLTLSLDNPSGPAAEELKHMFERLVPVSRLQYLVIYEPEHLLSAHPHLSQAISKLTSLRSIMLDPAGELSFEMLKSIRSKLEWVDISVDTDALEELDDEVDGDIIHILRPFSSGLSHLRAAWGGDTADSQDVPRYPLMRFLTLENIFSPITWHYVRAFPNIEDLCIAEGGLEWAMRVGLPEFRATNTSLLRQHDSWKALDKFEGELSMLWILGLESCPIRFLRVSIEVHDESVPEMLRDVLSSSRPAELELTFEKPTVFHDPAFVAAFAESRPPELKKLLLKLKFMNWAPENRLENNPDLDLGATLEAIAHMLRSFSTLQDLSLCIDIWFEDDVEDLLPAELFAMYMDADTTVSALRGALPSADKVKLALEGHRTKRDTVFIELEA